MGSSTFSGSEQTFASRFPQQDFDTFSVRAILILSFLVTLCLPKRFAPEFSHDSGSRWSSLWEKSHKATIKITCWVKLRRIIIGGTINMKSVLKWASPCWSRVAFLLTLTAIEELYMILVLLPICSICILLPDWHLHQWRRPKGRAPSEGPFWMKVQQSQAHSLLVCSGDDTQGCILMEVRCHPQWVQSLYLQCPLQTTPGLHRACLLFACPTYPVESILAWTDTSLLLLEWHPTKPYSRSNSFASVGKLSASAVRITCPFLFPKIPWEVTHLQYCTFIFCKRGLFRFSGFRNSLFRLKEPTLLKRMLHKYVGALKSWTFVPLFLTACGKDDRLYSNHSCVYLSPRVVRCTLSEFEWNSCYGRSSRILGFSTRWDNNGGKSPLFIASLSSTRSMGSRAWYDALSTPVKISYTPVGDGEWGSSSSRVDSW